MSLPKSLKQEFKEAKEAELKKRLDILKAIPKPEGKVVKKNNK